MERKKFEGKLSISNYMGDNMLRIELEDELSGARVITIEISDTELLWALRNHSSRKAAFTLGGLDFVGKKHEVRTVLVPWPRSKGTITREDLDQLLADDLVDGWRVNPYTYKDLRNGHRYKQDTFEASLERYVDEG